MLPRLISFLLGRFHQSMCSLHVALLDVADLVSPKSCSSALHPVISGVARSGG